MADGFALALQKAVLQTLRANTGVTDLVSNRIYDEPPQNVTFPYLRFNDITSRAFDTDTIEGTQIALSFEAHSRSASGRVEATQIAEAVREALHRQEGSINVAEFNIVEMIYLTYNVDRETDGRGHTAVIAFQAMLEETA
jgi:hypothetical protein